VTRSFQGNSQSLSNKGRMSLKLCNSCRTDGQITHFFSPADCT